ncbi:hypothetical protein DL96DRAFT_108118 [Flagelloscypha sp. PMI_526]|nr:hypothetical protein DL96DRAFT_108118 [Flagelloscypha sp. PMI_526]
MVLYPFHRDKITRRLLNLLVRCGPRIRKLWLCLNEGLPGPSLGMAEEFKRKHISLPSLRDLRVIYMPSTCSIWNPIIHKMISESLELEYLHVCLSDKSTFTTNRNSQLFLVPSGPPQLHPRLNFARLAGWDKTEPPRVLHFLHDYRFQLRTLHVGKIPSQVISRISELCALSSLSVLTDTMTLYSELLTVVNGLMTLRELHVAARKVEFTVYSSQAAFPPVPFHPLLENFSLETPIFNLLYLHLFAEGLPLLRCMSIRLIFAVPPSWKRPHLACGSPQLEVYEIIQGIHFRPDHSSVSL